MRKRIIALLLALILTVGLLPTVALAADGTTDGGSTGTISGGTVQVAGDPKQSVEHEAADDPIHIKKSVSEGENGKNYLTMEAYVTNPLEIKQEAVPIDIVLVLDVSGSMDDPLRNMNVPDFETYPNNMTNSDYLHYAQTGWGVYSAENEENKVNVTAADTYESVSRLTYNELKESGDNVSYYAKDNSGRYHSLSIKKYWGDWLQYYLYMDGEHYQKVHDWNSPIQLSGYEIYKLKTTYTYTDKTGKVILTSTGPNNLPTNNGRVVPFYYYNGETQKTVKKIDALKEAANNFITSVAEQELPADADGNAQYNRISIVKFAGDKYGNVGNDDYIYQRNRHNYSQIVKRLTNVDTEGVKTLQTAVSALRPAGATRADYGMEKAQEALKDHGTRPSVVIMFTDGTPTKTNTFDAEVASKAVNTAKALKEAGTFVYTIAVYDDAKPSEDPTKPNAEDFNKYLHAVSSNYPNATANSNGNKFNVTFGTRVSSEKNYYFNATNAIGLNNVFETISREVSNLALVVDSTAVLSDTLSSYFTFDGVAADNKTGITVKRVPVTGGNATTGFTWAAIDDTTKVTDLGTNGVEIKGKSIEVKNFNYGSDNNAVTVHADGRVTGAKLVITFPIKPDDSATWTEGTVNYPTNSTTSPNEAVLRNYALKSDKDNKNQQTQLTESPEIQIKAHTVSYEVAGNGNTGYTVPTSKVYREGQSYTIEDRLPDSNGYKFTGWCKDDKTCTSNPTTDPQTMGTANVTYYGKFEKNEVEVDLANYVKKTLTATSLPENFSETFTAKITGNDITEENGREIETEAFTKNDFTDFTGTTTATKTFKESKINLSVGLHTFTVTEDEGTNSNITYDKLPKTFTLNVTSSGATLGTVDAQDNFTAAADQFVTIGNSYNPTSTSFSLTNKFQKTLNSNVTFDDLPAGAKEFKLGIWEEANTTETADYIGTATISKLEGSGSSYSETVSFAFTSGLTFDTVGTKTYKVKEITDSVPGMKYDTTEYTMTIKVKDKAGKLTVTEATVSDGTNTIDLLNKEGVDSLEITNTFTAATLPLDPPSEEPESPTAGIKVFKSLTGDQKTETFTAKIYDGQTEKATAIADAKTGTLAAFDGFGTLVFTEAKTYNYIIKEIPGSTAGMKYDELFPNGHTMNITVEAEDNKLVVKTVTIDDKEINLADDAWLTITNTYTEPKNAQVTNKEVVVTQPEGALKTAVNAFEIPSQVTVLYPTGNGTTSNTLEVSYGTTAATLLYKITVYAGTESSYTFEDKDASFVYAENAKTVTKNGDYFTVTFEDGAEYAYVYVAVTHAISYDADGEYKARNFIGSQGAETTVTEKDPNKLTINFADFVKKELTATGSKTANDVKFRVIVNGMESPYMMYNVGEEEVSTYAAFDPKYSTVLNVNFASITGGNTETEWFIADNSIVIDQAGIYYFELNEEDGKRTGVTYDDSIYKVLVYVERKDDKLVVKSFDIMKDNVYVDGDTITFHNTIDTGKDDYYPIIIPTIINKDTGMLNKTDHFAYVIGYPDGTVHPNGQITRAEVATIFFRLLRDEVRDGAFTTSNTYSDVAYGKWYNNPISTMSALGIITGYPDGTFKPNKPITRAEFAAIAARFDETQSGKSATFSDVIGHWAAKEIGIAYYNDWIKGYPDGTFKPDQNITRAEAMTLINRVLERKPESPADLLTNMNKWTDNMDTSKWYYLDVQEATNSHGYTRKTFNYELWRQMLPDPDWSRYER